MRKFIIRRVLQAIPLLFVISFLSFWIYSIIPNTPFRAELALNPNATEEDIRRLEEKYGFNKPFLIRYVEWLGNVLRGDLGKSYFTKRPVFEMVVERLPATLTLTSSAFLISLLVGIPLGIFSALNRNTLFDGIVRSVTVFFTALPAWAIGLILIIILGGQLRLFPQGGMYTIGKEGDLLNRLHHLALPAFVAGIDGCVGFIRLMRSQTLEVLRQDFVRTAYAKGLSQQVVIWRHVLRNSFIPVWTSFGGLLAALVSGAAIFESIFSWPGMGRLVLDAVFKLDYPVVLAATMLGAVLILIGYVIVDIGYAWLDPRVRLD
ncbi:MAG: ABC transporter permease [Chloroflexi bacterium]|nr:ABC transporter permease [Chloroflexota bacterium]